MLDAPLRRLLGPALERGGALLARSPLTADQMTLAGVILALLAALAIVAQAYLWGLALLLLSRLADGLDGPIARAKGNAGSAWGGYLDSVADYVFYAAIPLAFALARPGAQRRLGGTPARGLPRHLLLVPRFRCYRREAGLAH